MAASDALAPLQQSVVGWIDADQVFPADGSALLTTLDQAREGLAGANVPAACAGMEAHIARVQQLIEAGILETADGDRQVAAATAVLLLLHSGGGSRG